MLTNIFLRYAYKRKFEVVVMTWDEFPWFRRRRRSPFFRGGFYEDFDEMMKDFERMVEETFKEFSGEVPRNLIRERKLPDGSVVREMGPFVYGYSVTVGPDGKPVVREFGNVKPTTKPSELGVVRPTLDIKETREPLVDVLSVDNEVKVVAELPGVEKSDIKLTTTETTLTISVAVKDRKFHKELELPAEVDPKTARSTYKNGVLEVTLTKIKKKPKGEPIKIE